MRGTSAGAFFVLSAMLMLAAGCVKGPPPDFYVLHATTNESVAGVEHGDNVRVAQFGY